MRLQTKIILYFLLMGIVPIAIGGGYFQLRVDDQIRSTSHDALNAIGSEVCREVQRTLSEAYNSIHLLAENPVLLSHFSTREEIEEELSKTTRFYPIIKDVSLVSMDGSTIASARYSFRGNWGASSWFRRGLDGESLISEVHAMIYPYDIVKTVVVPIIEGNDVRDVLIGHIDMEPIQNIIAGVSYGAASEIYIIDNRGFVVATTSDESLLLRLTNIPELSVALENDTDSPIHFSTDQSRLAVILPVDDPNSKRINTGWSLVLTMSENEAYAVAASIRRGLVFACLFSLVAVVVLSVFLGQPIVRRTTMMAKRATALGHGNYQTINDPGQDEIGEIARALNVAGKQLSESEQKIKNYQHNLKDLVRQKTQELHDSNMSLQEEIKERKLIESARSQMEEQLMHSQKMEAVGKLAGGIAHDFNNILQAISGYVQLLLKDKVPEHDDYAKLKKIEKSADRAGHLVQKLLLFSRKAPAKHVSLDLNQELEHCAGLLERVIPKMVQIKLKLQEGIKTLSADPVQVEQVILNLGVNASDAMPDGGTIVIETADYSIDSKPDLNYPGLEAGHYVLVTFSDTGHGMDKDTMSKIFEPFFTTKAIGRGTGLGLSSVYGIVLSHNGQIFCESAPGQGTKFMIFWPTTEAELIVRNKNEFKGKISNKGGGRILVVDDEPDILELTSEFLESYDYEIEKASSGEEALKIYYDQKNRIDLVILDLNMPGIGGLKCMQEMLTFDPEAIILITSGYSTDLMNIDFIKSGASGYLKKPYQPSTLLEQISKLLDRKT